MFHDMLLERPLEAALSHAGLAFLALLFASAFGYVGMWGLVATLVPVGLVRQAFAHRQELSRAEMDALETRRMLASVSQRVADEVLEERTRLASDLHDEVLPALFRVHLMGQVLRLDLGSGRLLELEEDLPRLLEAADDAASQIRMVITSLRRTSAKPGGVTPTLELLAKDLSREATANIEVEAEDVGCSPLTQLLIYQVAREALRNAVEHSAASKIRVQLLRDERHALLVVQDDGRGFDPRSDVKEGHFGVQMMRERVRMAGGTISIESSEEGTGTRVSARFPPEVPTP
jgi:signal transduction histidine kinase